MSTSPRRDYERLLELLADRATGALTEAERTELDALLAVHGADHDAAMDRAVAGAIGALEDRGHQMPAASRAKLEAIGRAMISPTAPRLGETSPGVIASPWAGRMGWFAAAAATILAVIGWWPRIVTPTPPVIREPSAADRLARLRTEATDLVAASFKPGNAPEGKEVLGEFVWSPSRQEGFLKLKNIQTNDPTKLQYQLWIFDGKRPAEYPIDGGVFDITSAELDPRTGEFLIRMNPKLPVRDAAMFAITIEEPGGVVVTDRQRIVVLGEAPKPTGG